MAGLKRNFKAPAAPPLKTLDIRHFGGLDLREGGGLTDPCRSPDALNMVIDDGYLPAKRTGYKQLRDLSGFGGRIRGLHTAVVAGEERMFIHVGSRLWLYREDGLELLYTGLADAPSSGFAAGGSYFLMDGTAIRKITGRTVTDALTEPYVPLTRKNVPPAGGGAHESPNLLTDRRRNSFKTDGETAVFKLDAYPVAGSVSARLPSGAVYTEGQGLSVYQHAGRVTFTTPPAAGEEGVVITYRAAGRPLGVAAQISRATLSGHFGGMVFLSGNPDYPGREWGSPDMAAAYFPDAMQGDVGDPAVPICGYMPHNEALVILKKPGNDTGVYLRCDLSPPVPGGDGPAATGGIGQLGGRCLYLAREGLMEITAASRSSARRSRPCGEAIAPLLEKTKAAEARAFVLGGRYYLPMGDGLIVGQLVPSGKSDSLEWNRWAPFAADGFGQLGGRLYFYRGGLLYRLCEAGEDGAYLDDGQPIAAHWRTPPLDMGDAGTRKAVNSLCVTLRPDSHSEAVISLGSDRESARTVGSFAHTRFGWQYVDFDRFGFGSLNSPVARCFGGGFLPATHVTLGLFNSRANSAMRLGPLKISYRPVGPAR